MSDQEELRIRRAIRDASQSGDSGAELKARRELRDLLSGGRPPPQPAPVAPPSPAPASAADVVLPMDPNAPEVPASGEGLKEITRAEQLRAENVDPTGEPISPQKRAAASFGISDLEGYRAALKSAGYEVREITSAGPLRGQIVYRKGPQDAWKSVTGAGQGLNLGDITSLAGEVLPTIGGFGGGAVGAMATKMPTTGTALGAGAGAATGEYAKIALGMKMGSVDPDTPAEDIIMAVMKRAGLEALGAAGGVIAYRAYKAFVGRGLPEIKLTEEQFRAKLAEVEQQVPRELITPGMVMGSTPEGAVLAAGEGKLSRQGDQLGDLMREKLQAREAYGRGLLETELQTQQRVPTPTAVGESVERAAPNAERAMERALGGGREVHPDLPITGERVRGSIPGLSTKTGVRRAYAEETVKIGKRFDDVVKAAKGQTVYPDKLVTTLQDIGFDLDQRVISGLSKDTEGLVKETLDRLAVDVGTPGAPKIEYRDIDYDTIAQGLKDIREAKRRAYRGEWTGEVGQLDALEAALVADRRSLLEALPNGKTLVNKLEGAETQYRELMDLFRRDALAELLKVRPGGAEAVRSSRITQKLFNDPDFARSIGNILNRRGFELDREAVRATLRWEANTAARDPISKTVNGDALARWVRNNEVVLRNFFSPTEVNRLFNAAVMERQRQAMGIKVGENPTQWFENFWSAKDANQAKATMNRLTSVDKSTADAVRGLVRQKLYGMMTEPGEQATGMAVKTEAVEKLLADPGRVDWLASVMDPGFGARLRVINEAVKTLFPKSQIVNLEERQFRQGVIGMAQRGGRLVFGPLTREGRIYNSMLSLQSDAIRLRAAEALLDPEKFALLLRASQQTAGGRARAAAIGQALIGQNLASEALGAVAGNK